jgi:iron(III) transport system permease protein
MAAPHRLRAPSGETLLAGGLILLMAILVVYPLGSLVYGSFTGTSPDAAAGVALPRFGLGPFFRIFTDPEFYIAWRNTLIVSMSAAVIALTFGLIAAFLITRTDLPAKPVFEKLVILPLFISPFIGAIAWSGLGAPRVGLINRMFAAAGLSLHVNIYSLPGIALVLGLYLTPYVFLFTSGPLALLDGALEEASRLSGQGGAATLRRITLPMITPSILAAGLLVMVLAMENFGVLAVLGTPSGISFVPTEIYLKISYPPPDYSYATVVSLTLILATGAGLFGQRRLMGRRSYVAIGGRGYRPAHLRLGRWWWPITTAAVVFLLASVALPIGAMVLASFQSYWAPRMSPFTLINYRDVFSRGLFGHALENSLLLSLGGAVLATGLATTIAYVVQRTRAPGRGLLDLMSGVSIAVPGVVLGVALLWAWIRVPLPIYGTLWILLIAYVTRFISFGIRNISAALSQVSGELEAAARVSGASKAVAAMTITVPLVRHSVMSSWVIFVISFLKELNCSVLLYSFNSVVLPVLIFDAYLEGHYTQVAALATGVSVLVFVILTLASVVFGLRIRPHA